MPPLRRASPADIQRLSRRELEQLCVELQASSQRAISVKQDLIETRDRLDRELGHYQRLEDYLRRGLLGSIDEFGEITAEVVLECFEVEFSAVFTGAPNDVTLRACIGLPRDTRIGLFECAWRRPALEVRTFSGAEVAEVVTCDVELAEITLCSLSTEDLVGVIVLGTTRAKASFFAEFAGDQAASLAVLGSSARALLENFRARQLSEIQIERLQEANRTKTELMANVSHDLRTPLNAIINLPEGLLESFTEQRVTRCRACNEEFALEDDEQLEPDLPCPACEARSLDEPAERLAFVGDSKRAHRMLKLIHRSGTHLLSVINDILDISSLEASGLSFSPASLVLEDALSQALETCEPFAADRRVTLCSEVPGGRTLIYGDRTRLIQIFVNLISNGVKFSPGDGEVRVSLVHAEAGRVTISVRDFGPGIAQEHQELIFESFRQAPHVASGWTREQGGTGLGLAICKKLVDMHGGTISVQSRLGEGADFRVTLPTAPDTED